jgi:hypothetical protein
MQYARKQHAGGTSIPNLPMFQPLYDRNLAVLEECAVSTGVRNFVYLDDFAEELANDGLQVGKMHLLHSSSEIFV